MNDTPALLIDLPLDRPAHWDAVQRIMRKLKDAFVNPYRFLVDGFRDGWMMFGFLTIVRAAEAEARRGLLCDALEMAPTLPMPAPRASSAPSPQNPSAKPGEQPLDDNFRAWRTRFQIMPPHNKPSLPRLARRLRAQTDAALAHALLAIEPAFE